MNINMTTDQYKQLTDFSKSSKIEQSGIINVVINGNDILCLQFTPTEDEEIKEATRAHINFNINK